MANRYWVGADGAWDATTTHWSETSGGASGATVPTLSDDVYFDASSGGGSVTLSGEKSCLAFTSTGFTGGIAGTVKAYGAVVRGTTANHTVLNVKSGAAGAAVTLTSNGETVSAISFATNCNMSLLDALTVGTVLFPAGGGNTLKLKDGATTTVTDITWPTSGSSTLQSTSAGVQATLSDSSGTNTITYTTVQDIIFTGGATWATGTSFSDGGNNIGLPVQFNAIFVMECF